MHRETNKSKQLNKLEESKFKPSLTNLNESIQKQINDDEENVEEENEESNNKSNKDDYQYKNSKKFRKK